jgi:hypothetical protein
MKWRRKMSAVIEDKEFWHDQLEKLKISGLSRFQYCRENDINYDRFGYWIKKLSPAISKFIPVKLQTSEVTVKYATLCTIELRGHILKIHDLSVFSLILERLA